MSEKRNMGLNIQALQTIAIFTPMKTPLILISALILWVSACGPSSPESDAPAESYALNITNDGLSFVQLGEPVDSIRFPKGTQIQEELVTEAGYQWRMLTAFLPSDEKVVIEGDFVDEGDPAGRLPDSKVNRIHVDGPAFATADGIKVGMGLKDLQAVYPDSVLQAIFIVDYDIIDVRTVGLGRLHYNFNEVDGQASAAAGGTDAVIPLSAIPEKSKIVSIVVSF